MSQLPVSSQESFEPFSTDKARKVVGFCAGFSLLAGASVVARFYSRTVKGVRPELSDWLVVGSLFFYFTFTAQEILCVKIGGLGHHIDDIPLEYAYNLAKISVFCQVSYTLSMSLVRWSICSLLRRIFWTPTFRKIALGIIIFNALWTLFGILSIALRCLPPSDSWNDPSGPHCASEMPFLATTATWGLLIEIIIWSTPIPMVWNLNTPRSNKIALTAIFAFGFLDIIVGIIRLISVVIINFKDASYSEAFAVYWIIIEPSISIMVVSLPLCRPLFDMIFPRRIIELIRPHVTTRKTSEKYANGPNGDRDDNVGLYPSTRVSSDRRGNINSQLWRPPFSESSNKPRDGCSSHSQSNDKGGTQVRQSITLEHHEEV